MPSSRNGAGTEQCEDLQNARHFAATSSFVSFLDWEAISGCLELSRRESQITYLLLADLSEGEIATDLDISAHTVHSHVERLYRKLHVRSRCALIVKVFEVWVALGMPTQPPAKLARDRAEASHLKL